MTTNNAPDLIQRISVVLSECADVASFLDRFAAADPREQVTMGTKHLKMLEQAVRRAAALAAEVVSRDAGTEPEQVPDPVAPAPIGTEGGVPPSWAETGTLAALSYDVVAENVRIEGNNLDGYVLVGLDEAALAVLALVQSGGETQAEQDARFERDLGASYRTCNYEASARTLSSRLRHVDLRARAANRRADALEAAVAELKATEPPIDEHTVGAVAEALSNGGWWKSCTGCHETNEGQETGGYPFSKLFQCYTGAGCTECGGIGVVWEYYTSEQYDAMMRAATPSEQAATRSEDLDRRLKEHGMFTIGEMMGTTPLTRWQTHTGVQDLESFAGWLDSQVRQFLTMQAEYQVGNKGEEDELYAWVQAHSAALQAVRINFRAALSRSAAPLLALVDELDRKAEFERLLTVDDGRRVAALARQLVAHLRETYPLPPRKED